MARRPAVLDGGASTDACNVLIWGLAPDVAQKHVLCSTTRSICCKLYQTVSYDMNYLCNESMVQQQHSARTEI